MTQNASFAAATDVCLIAEKGTDWGARMEHLRAEGLAVAAIIQSPFESIGVFTARVRKYLATLAAEGCPPSTTVLVGARDWSDRAIQARCEAVRALAGAVKDRTRLRLVLTCDPHASSDDVAGMHALSDTIARVFVGSPIDVTCTTPRLARATRLASDAVSRVVEAARPSREVA
jgi:hypothetical protein